MRTFLVSIPGTAPPRTVRHEAESIATLAKRLLVGHGIVGEVVDGVSIAPPLPDGLKQYTLMTSLLRDHGPELAEWLRDAGFSRAVDVAPSVE